MIVWGGFKPGVPYLSSGARYDPHTDRWTPTAATSLPRQQHTAVWTGSQMIVWGGQGISVQNTGWRYDPVADQWSARYDHSAVWTGREMIVWGGTSGVGNPLDTGGRYDPASNTWTPTATGADAARGVYQHSAVWTGTQMIVWAGTPAFGETARNSAYCACPSGTLFYADADGDGFGDAASPGASCDGTIPPGHVLDASDCNDADPSVHPGGIETCNGVDDNCDGQIDEDAAGVESDGTTRTSTTSTTTAKATSATRTTARS